MAARYVCKCCGKEMFSLVEVVEDWNDIYCKACNPEAPPPRPQPSVDPSPQRPPPRAAAYGAHLPRRTVPIRRPRWWEAAYGAEVPLMFLIRARRAAPHGTDVPPLAPPTWDVERALAALDVTEVPFDSTCENLIGYARGRTIAVSPSSRLPHLTRFHELAHVLLGHTTEGEHNDDALTPRNLRECEAEAVAMRCCAALGLPGVEVGGTYIGHVWGAGKIPRRSAQRIQKAVDQILEAGTSTPADDEDRS